jgi:hypothetical protein
MVLQHNEAAGLREAVRPTSAGTSFRWLVLSGTGCRFVQPFTAADGAYGTRDKRFQACLVAAPFSAALAVHMSPVGSRSGTSLNDCARFPHLALQNMWLARTMVLVPK